VFLPEDGGATAMPTSNDLDQKTFLEIHGAIIVKRVKK
jgi:hypothetical protein